jgi:hypothetical protein
MVEAFGNARAQDTNSARYEVPRFVPLDPLVDVVQPPSPMTCLPKLQSSRRWQTDVPPGLRLMPEYEKDPI